MRFCLLPVARSVSILLVEALLCVFLAGTTRASNTNVFNVNNSLRAAGINAAGARVATFKGSTSALLGTNSSASLAIAVFDTDCTPTGVHPSIRLVAFNHGTGKIIGTLIEFTAGSEIHSGDDELIMTARGTSGTAAEGADVDALITFRYQPCTSTNSPTRPTSVSIQPLGTFKPTGNPSFQAPITPDNGAILFLTEDENNPVLQVNTTGVSTTPSPNCNIDLNATALTFGTVSVGSNSVQTLIIRNNGLLPCTVNSITRNGSSAFTVNAPVTPFTVPAGSAINVPITFTPTANGGDSAILRVTSTDPITPQQYINLSGNGTTTTPCNINVSPLLLPFGSIEIGTNRTLSVTVTNTGGQDCTVDLITLVTQSSNFNVSAPTVPFTVAAGSAQIIEVTYTPTDATSASGTLEIDTDDTDNRLSLISLTGAGVTATCRLAAGPTSLDFGAVVLGNNRALSIGITNTSLIDCTIGTNTTFAGSHEFALDIPIAEPIVLTPGDSTSLTFVYTPTNNGTASGSATLAASTPIVISFSGRGVAGTPNCSFAFSRSEINFGDLAVGSVEVQKFQISNTSATNCTIQSIQITGSSDFTLIAPTIPLTLGANQTVEIGVRYAPGGPGSDLGQLRAITGDEFTPITDIPLSGNGIQVALVVSTNSVDFGSIPVFSDTRQTVYITNTNTVDATITSITRTGSGDFILDPIVPTGRFILRSFETVEIPVTYLPSNQGSDAGTINITGNQVGSPTAIQLAGVGLRCNLSVTPGSLAFGTVQLNLTNTLTVTINNTGNTNCMVDAIEFLGSGRYRVVSPSAPFNVNAGQPVTVSIDYVPVNIQSLLLLGGTVKSSGNPTVVTP